MDALGARDPLQFRCNLHQLGHRLAPGGRRHIRVVGLVLRVQQFLEIGRAQAGRNHPGHAVDIPQVNTQNAADIPNGGPRFHAPEGHNLGHAILAVPINGVLDHLFPLVVGKVQVEVRHGQASGIEETLENQVVLEGIDARDPQRTGHDRTGSRTSHVEPDVFLLGIPANIGHDQEVGLQLHVEDHVQLGPQAVLCGACTRTAPVQLPQTRAGQLLQIGLVRLESLRQREPGHVIGVVLRIDVAHLGNLDGPVEHVAGKVHLVAEGILHLAPGSEEVAVSGHAHPLGIAPPAARLHAQQNILVLAVGLARVVHVVAGNHLQVELFGQAQQALVDDIQFRDVVPFQFQEKPLPGEGLHIPRRTLRGLVIAPVGQQPRDFRRQAAGRADQAFAQLPQTVVIHPGLVVETIQMGLGAQFEQVAIAGVVLGQQEQVVALGIQGLVPTVHGPTPLGQVGLNAQHRVDAVLVAGSVEVDRAMHDAVVGQRQGRLSQFGGACHQPIEAVQAVQEGIFGVGVKVNEGV